jgi:hypothetical protein
MTARTFLRLGPNGALGADDALADDFDYWKADPARRGTPVARRP